MCDWLSHPVPTWPCHYGCHLTWISVHTQPRSNTTIIASGSKGLANTANNRLVIKLIPLGHHLTPTPQVLVWSEPSGLQSQHGINFTVDLAHCTSFLTYNFQRLLILFKTYRSTVCNAAIDRLGVCPKSVRHSWAENGILYSKCNTGTALPDAR